MTEQLKWEKVTIGRGNGHRLLNTPVVLALKTIMGGLHDFVDDVQTDDVSDIMQIAEHGVHFYIKDNPDLPHCQLFFTTLQGKRMSFIWDGHDELILVSIIAPSHLYKGGGSVITGRLSQSGEFAMQDIRACQGKNMGELTVELRMLMLCCIATKTKRSGPVDFVPPEYEEWDNFVPLTLSTGESLAVFPSNNPNLVYRISS